MTCDKCEHFEIMYEPQRDIGVLWDLGRAHCKKHNLVVDFVNHGKFKLLECPDKEGKGMSDFKVGEYIVYVNGDRYDVGKSMT